MSNTPRTDALTDADFVNIDEDMETATLKAYNRLHDLCADLERELSEALEWKQYLSSWGGTPQIVFSFIQGQQARIRAAQEVEKQRDLLIEGLEKLASLDFVITLPDRMDAVRKIANETLNKQKP